ncbi:MAG: DUF2795 domain-containing protein [Candidatus Saccharibacteria bacterium]
MPDANETEELEDQAYDLESFLEGVPYPASRDEIIAHASQRGAPEELLQLMEGLPDRQFDGTDDIRLELNMPKQ